jgi:hypothetical protein
VPEISRFFGIVIQMFWTDHNAPHFHATYGDDDCAIDLRTEGEVDASRLILAPYAGVFERLRDPAQFAEAFVSDGVVTWPGELDLAPDAMHKEIKANGHWRIEPFPHE